eukprot:6552790-Ditylum_brightwellii.AAC.1
MPSVPVDRPKGLLDRSATKGSIPTVHAAYSNIPKENLAIRQCIRLLQRPLVQLSEAYKPESQIDAAFKARWVRGSP